MRAINFLVGLGMFLCLLVITGCKTCGTGAGNPFSCTAEDQAPIRDPHSGLPPSTISEKLVFGLCNIIVGCETQLISTQCASELFAGNWLNEYYQLEYPSFSETKEAEREGHIQGSSEKLNGCLAAIATRSCSDSLLGNAYPFDGGLLALLEVERAECGTVLEPRTELE